MQTELGQATLPALPASILPLHTSLWVLGACVAGPGHPRCALRSIFPQVWWKFVRICQVEITGLEHHPHPC